MEGIPNTDESQLSFLWNTERGIADAFASKQKRSFFVKGDVPHRKESHWLDVDSYIN